MLGGRVNSFFGLTGDTIPTIASAATLVIPDNVTNMYVSGSTTVTLLSSTFLPGRVIVIYGTGGVVLTNTDDTTTLGQMDLGGSNLTLAASDIAALMQRNDGSWVRLFSTDN